MDYATLAKQYGGVVAPQPQATNNTLQTSKPQKVDYSALARQYGGVPAESTNGNSTAIPQQDNRDFLQKAGDVIGAIFPGKQIGQDIGTLAGYGLTAAKEGLGLVPKGSTANYDLSAPTPIQAVGDAAQGALMVAMPGAPESAGIGTKIAANAALGAGFGATSAVANGSTNIGDIAKQTAFGAATGGIVAGATEGVSKLLGGLPNRIVNNLLPQLKNPETVDYAINNLKLGSVDSMKATSDAAKSSYFKQINAILEHPDVIENANKLGGSTINGSSVYENAMKAYPNSELTQDTFFSKIKTLAPNDSKLVTNLEKGDISLEQANQLRQVIGGNIFKSKIDSPEVKAGKDLGATTYNILKDFIQTRAPETAPLFDGYSKEINLNQALSKLQQKTAKAGVVSFKELLGALGGAGLFGPVGGIATLGAEKIATTPAVMVGAAKTINAARPLIKGATSVANLLGANAGRIPITSQDQ